MFSSFVFFVDFFLHPKNRTVPFFQTHRNSLFRVWLFPRKKISVLGSLFEFSYERIFSGDLLFYARDWSGIFRSWRGSSYVSKKIPGILKIGKDSGKNLEKILQLFFFLFYARDWTAIFRNWWCSAKREKFLGKKSGGKNFTSQKNLRRKEFFLTEPFFSSFLFPLVFPSPLIYFPLFFFHVWLPNK